MGHPPTMEGNSRGREGRIDKQQQKTQKEGDLGGSCGLMV